MIHLFSFFSWILFCIACNQDNSNAEQSRFLNIASEDNYDSTIITGADQLELYLSELNNKYVALVVNQTSVIHETHLVDTLLSNGIKISLIFSPEHGFRGVEDAGATIENSKDLSTGIPIISLYGNTKKPTTQNLQDIDVVLFDIQDVGTRFYTYISTLQYVMEACAENNKLLIVLDRPNPNGFYVDGPVLDIQYQSFVGLNKIPIVYGMTIGEYAQMINEEKWLNNGMKCNLKIIKCQNYEHTDYYQVNIPPSPNLKTMQAIYLYPSLCWFEGTTISVGRGTEKPFEIYGSPNTVKTNFTFTPRSTSGAKSPPYLNRQCNGVNLSETPLDSLRSQQINLHYILDAYQTYQEKSTFFLSNHFFYKLSGNDILQKQIEAGLSTQEIKLSWQEELIQFKSIRKKYLLYPDFE